jgi:hypothetical protein
MTAATLLQNLHDQDVRFTAVDGLLEIDGPEDVLTPEVLQTLTDYKPELVALLSAPSDLPPCAVCGGTDRWQDLDVWRCATCERLPLTADARALPRPPWPPARPPLRSCWPATPRTRPTSMDNA